ncbi:hypothetical protein NC997_06975 [Trichocoleus sp. DQ-A2]|uniref:hypothetical protein n=1 Tax=Trichocoleus sp. DQ-A2 TaxID=2933924 RepID=UPI00168659AD
MLELKFVQWDEAFSSHVFIMSKQSGYVSEENRIAFWGIFPTSGRRRKNNRLADAQRLSG